MSLCLKDSTHEKKVPYVDAKVTESQSPLVLALTGAQVEGYAWLD